jgi:tryptophan-rich sensory protein
VRKRASRQTNWTQIMLYTIAVILLVLWALGLVTGNTIGGFIHVLLVVAIVMVLVNLISGRRRLN